MREFYVDKFLKPRPQRLSRHLNSQYHCACISTASFLVSLYSPPSFSTCSSSPLPLFPSLLTSSLLSLLPLSLLPPPQGLYEYAKPAWQERPRPQVDEGKVKNFGQNVAPRPLHPAEKQLQLYPVAMEINGVEAPRYSFSLYLLITSHILIFHPPLYLSSFPPPFLPPFLLSLSPLFYSFSSSLSALTAP